MQNRWLLQRLVRTIIVLFGVSTVVFFVARLTGDPAALMMSTFARPEDVEAFRHVMGFDQPLHLQYFRFLTAAVQGDFGRSFQYHLPALPLVLDRMPATIQLAVASLALAALVGVPLGVTAATKRNSAWDFLCTGGGLLGQSIPIFWLGIMLIMVFSVQLRWLPVSGRGTLAQMVLPTITLASWSMASIARLTRSTMLDVIGQDYIRTARAKGLRERFVIYGHGLRNAAIPVVTILGVQFGTLLSGAVVTETIFAWPGVGWLTILAIYYRDFPLVQASVFVSAIAIVLTNLAVDLLYLYLNPRIRYS